ncbi:alpha/beta hydrolase [Pseudonocardia kujensis]|uniref:alpha/beta hydrolase fold domain-containing protein n=1 Tax=Pseudonocardia kujensis TaxID=1128675 RepID=UPI001E61EC86|nr:alpha/beta hydrolase fold domain-containing protein [Pseudonocardia kujensis]MCE0765693.1 alpha/beta hydrolase [Pseudonocardia kujensis]
MVSARVNDMAAAAYAGWLREDATLEEMRTGFDGMCPEPAADATLTEGVVGGVRGTWVEVPGSGATTILHFHAGGYLIGSPTSHRDLGARLARAAGARVFLADYRLAPEHAFPAAHDDGVAAYRGMLADGVDPGSLVVSGDSAGGGLALAVLAAARDAGDPLPAAGVLMSPWADLTLSGDSMDGREAVDPLVSRAVLTEMQQGYLQGADPADHRASPLLGNLAGLPPLLVQVGSSEVLEDDAVRIADGVLRAGGEAFLQVGYEMVHVFPMFADRLPEGAAAIDRIGAFVRAQVRSAVVDAAAV